MSCSADLPVELARHYEELRSDVSGGRLTTHGGLGLTLLLTRGLSAWMKAWSACLQEVLEAIDELLDQHTDAGVAENLNRRGYRSGTGKPLSRLIVKKIRRAYGLRPRYDRLREAGLLTRDELAEKLGVASATIKHWRQQGLLVGIAYSDKPQYLYEAPGAAAPIKYKHKRKAAASANLHRT